MLTSVSVIIRIRLFLLAAIVASLFLGSCDQAATPEASHDVPSKTTPASHGGGVIAEYRESIHPELPPFRFTLTGTKPGADQGPARVRTIEIRRDSEPDPFQVIDGVNAETPVERPAAFEAIDMNFDGYRDIRLIESAPAGPNVPYRNWLFDSSSEKFEPSPGLDQITSPVFDPEAKSIRSAWRDGPTRYGEDTYKYFGEQLVLVRREERRFSAPGVYRLTISVRTNGELKVIESRDIRE